MLKDKAPAEADSEHEKDESNDFDSNNVAGADQYGLQDDVSPANFCIRKIVKTV
jgi:hypothetical protein